MRLHGSVKMVLFQHFSLEMLLLHFLLVDSHFFSMGWMSFSMLAATCLAPCAVGCTPSG